MLAATAALAVASLGSRRTQAAPSRIVKVPHMTFAAIATAVVGGDATVAIDEALPVATMQVGDRTFDVGPRLLLKGEGAARRRYLDDARNAPKVSAAVRDAVRTVWPELDEAVGKRQKGFARGIVGKVLRWSGPLVDCALRGKRVRDDYGRIYLLEWAGAVVTADGAAPPAALADAPATVSSPSAGAYHAYVKALVESLVAPTP